MSCEGRERAKGRESGPLRGHLRARGGAGIGEGPDCAVWAAFAHLSESIPIAYQYTKHVNDVRTLAHHATLRSQPAVSTRHATLRSQPVKSFSVERYATSQVSAQSARVSASQRKSGAGKCSKISDLGRVRAESGLESVARTPTGVARRGAG
jgi:hypothetical protein